MRDEIKIGKMYIQKNNPRLLPNGEPVIYRLTHLDDKSGHLLAINDLLTIAVSLDWFEQEYREIVQ